jgi:tripartite ATP-independent transporter DctP family solute receptor
MNAKKLSIITVLLVFCIGGLTTGLLAAETEVEWTFAHPHSIEHPWGKHGQILSELIEERSEGRFKISYLPGGVLGSEHQIFDQLVTGTIQMMLAGPASIEGFYPPISIVQSYYVFRDIDHMHAAMKTPGMQKLFDEAQKASGVRTIDIWYYGTRQLTTRFPVHTPEDLKNKKIRSTESHSSIANIAAMGAVATPIAFPELYMALQSGVVDGQENPLPTIKAQAFHEVQDYLILTNHNINAGILVVNEESFQSLPEDLQEILITTSDEVNKMCEEAIIAEENELLDYFADYMTIIEPDVEAFRKQTLEGLLKKYGDVWDEGLLESIQAIK